MIHFPNKLKNLIIPKLLTTITLQGKLKTIHKVEQNNIIHPLILLKEVQCSLQAAECPMLGKPLMLPVSLLKLQIENLKEFLMNNSLLIKQNKKGINLIFILKDKLNNPFPILLKKNLLIYTIADKKK